MSLTGHRSEALSKEQFHVGRIRFTHAPVRTGTSDVTLQFDLHKVPPLAAHRLAPIAVTINPVAAATIKIPIMFISGSQVSQRSFVAWEPSRTAGQLPSDQVTNRVQNIDQIPRRLNFSEKCHLRQHIHLVIRDVVDASKLFVLSELVQGRNRTFCPLRSSREKYLSARVGEKKQFAVIEAEHFRQSRDNQVGRVALARFQVPYIWRRSFNPRSDFVLRKIQLSSSGAYHFAKIRFLRTHR